MTSIDELIAKKKNRAPAHLDVDLDMGGELATFRFTEMDGLEWGQITALYPPRTAVPLDLQYGYDFHAATLHAAPLCGRLLVGEETHEVTEKQWAEILGTASGHEIQQVASAVWELNEWAPSQRIEAMKKASAGGSKPKQS